MNALELDKYLSLKEKEIVENKEILKKYISQKNALVKKQEQLELEIVDALANNIDIELKKKELENCVLEVHGLIKEISYTEELISNLEFDLEMSKLEAQKL